MYSYSLAFKKFSTFGVSAANEPIFTIQTGQQNKASIVEFGCALQAPSAGGGWVWGRPAANGSGILSTYLFQGEDPTAPAAQSKLIMDWSTFPTVPTSINRRWSNAGGSNGFMFTFPRGLGLPKNQQWCMFQNSGQANQTLDGWIVIDE